MAGYVVNESGPEHEFHINDMPAIDEIMIVSDNPRVITLQLDGDELAAVLWGLMHYKK